MALYLVCIDKPEHGYEVVSYDKATHTAVLRNDTGTYTDRCFFLETLKTLYRLTDVKPSFLTE
jgi:hypothetical protein